MQAYRKFTLSILTLCISQHLHAEINKPLEYEKIPMVKLDAIVVTAGKIDRTAQETLDSVNITTADQMQDDPTLDDVSGILNKAPNVNINAETNFSIRGISRGGVGGGVADTFSVVVDGVAQNYMANMPGLLSTWDLEQVEILRGPQSTTSGRNALAGAIVVSSKDPEFTQSSNLQLGYGTDNTYQVAIANTGAITENLAYRISAERKHTDGHTTNITFNKDDWNSQTAISVRGKLLYFIDNDSKVMLTVSDVNHDRDGIRTSISPDERINTDNIPVYFNTDVTNVSLKYHDRISDDWSLTSTTGYQDLTFERQSDYDGNNGDAAYNNDRSSNNWSQELLFNYDNADDIEAVFGLYATQGDFKNSLSTLELPYNIQGYKITADYITYNVEEYTNYAAFTNVDYHITPKVTLIGGLRFDYDKRDTLSDPTARLVQGTGITPVDQVVEGVINQIGGDFDDSNSQTVWLPKLGIDYAWTDNLNTGFVYQRGYRPGGISANVVTQSSQEYDEEYTDNYEFSLRARNNNGFSLTGNIFYTDWKDQQVSVNGETGLPGDYFVMNAGESHLYGAEIETGYKITPKIELTGGVGYVKTEFDEFVSNETDYSGKEFTEARDITASIGATYRTNSWFAGLTATHQGEAWSDLANTNKIDDYTLVNLKAGYEADSWGAFIQVNNLLDKTYIQDTIGYRYRPNTYNLGDPRTVGVTVNYKW